MCVLVVSKRKVIRTYEPNLDGYAPAAAQDFVVLSANLRIVNEGRPEKLEKSRKDFRFHLCCSTRDYVIYTRVDFGLKLNIR